LKGVLVFKVKVLIAALIVVAALAVMVLLQGAATVGASEPSPSASPTVTADQAPEPASAAQVRSALKAKRRAVAARKALSRVRACFRARSPIRVYPAPQLAATAQEWGKAQRRWTWQTKDWGAKVKAGIAKMRHPGGGGAARWWPAARWCAWPEHLKGWFCYVVWRESSARAHAVNSSSGCYGLLQLHPCHWASKGRAWISDVLNQLRLGWQLYRQYGPSPWALT